MDPAVKKAAELFYRCLKGACQEFFETSCGSRRCIDYLVETVVKFDAAAAVPERRSGPGASPSSPAENAQPFCRSPPTPRRSAALRRGGGAAAEVVELLRHCEAATRTSIR